MDRELELLAERLGRAEAGTEKAQEALAQEIRRAISVGLSKAPGYCAAVCLLFSVIDPSSSLGRAVKRGSNETSGRSGCQEAYNPPESPGAGTRLKSSAIPTIDGPSREGPHEVRAKEAPAPTGVEAHGHQPVCALCFVPYISHRARSALSRVPVARQDLRCLPFADQTP